MNRFASVLTVLFALTAAPARAADPIYLDQGWSIDDRAEYYALPQGSEVMPYRWFLALEQPWDEKLFRDSTHIRKVSSATCRLRRTSSTRTGSRSGSPRGAERTARSGSG